MGNMRNLDVAVVALPCFLTAILVDVAAAYSLIVRIAQRTNGRHDVTFVTAFDESACNASLGADPNIRVLKHA